MVQQMLQPVAKVYLAKDGLIGRDENGYLEMECRDVDMFASYLCKKGAVVVGNLLENPKLLENEAIAIKDMKDISRYGDYLFLRQIPYDNYNVFRLDGTPIASIETSAFYKSILCRYYNDFGYCYEEQDVDSIQGEDGGVLGSEEERQYHLNKIAEILAEKEKENILLEEMKNAVCYEKYWFFNKTGDNYDILTLSEDGKPQNIGFVETSSLTGKIYCRCYKDAQGSLYPSCYVANVANQIKDCGFLSEENRQYHLKEIAKVLKEKEVTAVIHALKKLNAPETLCKETEYDYEERE